MTKIQKNTIENNILKSFKGSINFVSKMNTGWNIDDLLKYGQNDDFADVFPRAIENNYNDLSSSIKDNMTFERYKEFLTHILSKRAKRLLKKVAIYL